MLLMNGLELKSESGLELSKFDFLLGYINYDN